MVTTFLIFDRPFTRRFTEKYKELYGHRFDIRFISDFKYRDDVGLCRRQYEYLADPDIETREFDLDYEVIVRRCRYLRAINAQLSRTLINAAWLAIGDILAETRPAAFIGLPLDNYFLDLLNIACLRRGIFTINPLQSFLPNLIRITTRGELQPVREPDDAEVDTFRKMLLTKSFKPAWLSGHRTRADLLRLWAKERGKKVFFESMKFLKKDPYSFHYNTIFPLPGILTVESLEIVNTQSLFVRDVEKLEERARGYSTTVFFPLQFTPEVSLNYHIPDSRFSGYEKLLDTVLDSLPEDVFLIVKEHPDVYGYRRVGFYERFLNRPNVALIDVSVAVQELFELSPFVLVTGGASTGAEAIVKGLTVISLGGAYFGGPELHEIRDFGQVEQWPHMLIPIRNDDAATHTLVRRIVSNCLPGPYKFVRPSRSKEEKSRTGVRTIMSYVTENVIR